MNLRPYQKAAVDSVLSAKSPCLFVMPTGTGKTLPLAEIFRRSDGRVLLLAHRIELLQQARKTIKRHAGWEPGIIGGGLYTWNHQWMTATVPSLHKSRRDSMDRVGWHPDTLLIDECHHATSPTYRAIIDWAVDRGCKRVIGCTATPYRLDDDTEIGTGLANIFGERPAYTYPLRDAVRDGWPVPIRQWGIETTTTLEGCPIQGGDFSASGLSVIDCPERNLLVADSYRELCEGRQALCFAVTVAHAQNLATAFEATGTRAEAIWGDMPTDDRRATLQRYRDREIQVVVNVGILTEGFDDPQSGAVLMARPTTSLGLYTQCVGRGLRPFEHKSDCIVIDYLDAGKRHALTTQSALKLAGLPGEIPIQLHDCQGKINTVAAAELIQEHLDSVAALQHMLQIRPLEWSAKNLTPRWSADVLELSGYEPQARWEKRSATQKQLKYVRSFGFAPKREITAGEASVLIDRLITLDAESPEMATPKQAGMLSWKGVMSKRDALQLTKREASRMIAAALGKG